MQGEKPPAQFHALNSVLKAERRRRVPDTG